MSRKKISTTIYVTPEQSERLRLLHERTKVPVAVYIREGIDLVLRQYDHLLPGQLPLAASHGDANGPPPALAGRGQHLEAQPPPSTPEAKPERAAGAGKG
ncbi:MAG TPA: ribbon-helix-helix domain-containing protein [Polyangiaceae bacterium]|nr:ribbon-helix-helix domain-containing protein [Polyangiaceae bacterium]